MRMSKVPTRNRQLLAGLIDMINYIDNKFPCKDLTICEIGSWCGSSANEFAKRFKYVFCIDPWEASAEINTQYNMQFVEDEFDKMKSNHRNITKIKDFSYNVVSQFRNCYFDIVYVDGEHSYEAVKKDIELYLPKTKLFIAGHDYWLKKFPGVVRAVNETVGQPDKVFKDSSWIKRIRS
jgi:hypothetical protein